MMNGVIITARSFKFWIKTVKYQARTMQFCCRQSFYFSVVGNLIFFWKFKWLKNIDGLTQWTEIFNAIYILRNDDLVSNANAIDP